MITLTAVDDLRAQVNAWKEHGESIGFVPTMGNLHAGHLTLVREAQKYADKVIVSIFVNPTQFGPDEDYDSYPRTLEQDEDKLLSCQTDLLYLPSVETMYGDLQQQTTRVCVPALSEMLCGASRPGHFDGVATVVNKLFHQVMPDVAIFGEKDYQQLLVIRRMCVDLALPVRIIGVPTQREPDGLAMSSRNVYLSPEEREIAPRLHGMLEEISHEIQSSQGEYQQISHDAIQRLEAFGFLPEYVEIRRASDLNLPEKGDTQLIILAAARLGDARLIDNQAVEIH